MLSTSRLKNRSLYYIDHYIHFVFLSLGEMKYILLIDPCVKHLTESIQKDSDIHWRGIFAKLKKVNNIAVENCDRLKSFSILLAFRRLYIEEYVDKRK